MALLKTHAHNYTDLYKLNLWVLLLGMFQQQRSRTDAHCPVICVITCPSQCRYRQEQVEQDSSCVLGPRSETSKLWLTCQSTPQMWNVNCALPSPAETSCSVTWTGQAHEISKCWKLPLLQHHSGTGSAGTDTKWWHHGSPRNSLTCQSREEFGNSY